MSEYTLMKSKVHYTFETLDREMAFEEKKANKWEEEYKSYRKKWQNNPKNRIVDEYPLNIDIALTNFCNLKCPMCYTVSDEYNDKYTKCVMDEELYKKIIDEIANKVPAIRFVSYGEQTLHPQFSKFMKYAKEKGVKEISLVTNGSRLKEDFIEEIILAGLDWLVISIDGMNETYEAIRKPMKFENIVNSVKNIKKIKEKYKTEKPVLQIQTIWSAIENNYEEYYEFFKKYADSIHFNPTFDYAKADKMVYEENCCCPQLYQRMDIGVDGKVYPCCAYGPDSEAIGDIREKSIYDIWHGKKLTGMRKLHEDYVGFEKIYMCKGCVEGAKMEIEKRVQMSQENREFDVYKYIYKE